MTGLAFGLSAGLVAYTYGGYGVVVAMLSRWRSTTPLQASLTPPITVIIAAHNEASRIAARICNVFATQYPAENLQVIVVSDGSSDATERAAASVDPRVRVIAWPKNRGKAAALNAALALADTEFVVFADVRQRFTEHTLSNLLSPFSDPEVGAVSGELKMVVTSPLNVSGKGGDGLYWRMEKLLRENEARIHWLHGVSGAVYALRRKLFVAMPEGTILDDVWVPMHVVWAGQRVWMARDAVAYDTISVSSEEFWRKLRTLAGNWQLLVRLPRLLNPRRNPVFFAWVSHKLLRLISPWALIVMLVSSAILHGTFYQFAFFAQIIAYVGAAFALVAPRTAMRLPFLAAAGAFLMLNTAALLSLPACALGARTLWKKH